MLSLTELIGFGAGQGPAAAASYLAYASDATKPTTVTFSAMSFGTAADNRRLSACVQWDNDGGNTRTISSLTIGGVAATVHQVANSSATDNKVNVAIASASVPTGTSGDVVVTWSGTVDKPHVALWRVTSESGTPIDSDKFESTGDAAVSVTLTVEPGSVLIAAATAGNASANITWTNATEGQDDTNGAELASAYATVSSGGSLQVTSTSDDTTPDRHHIVAVAFR